ncbi:unnamed protein product [Allacma fusca]|uniref:Uncharacterized protein n=1 Tax=Allacma fusca TaxID=39272 RepID=A0A8J2JE37_9HEXA|nr:unnamed protein product [Allacma fusca]
MLFQRKYCIFSVALSWLKILTMPPRSLSPAPVVPFKLHSLGYLLLSAEKMSAGLTLSYHIVPPLFLIIFTSAAQYLAQAGNPDRKFQTWFILGNCFAWKVVGSLLAWALLWLWIPSKKFPGPTTSFGYTPIYQANGELYYVGSLAMLGCVVYINPTLCVSIYQNMGPILGVLNVLAFSLCTYLLIKAKLDRNPVDPYLRTSVSSPFF